MHSCDGKAEFLVAITPVSHNPSEIILCWFGAQEIILSYF